jgi:hypothetical protein
MQKLFIETLIFLLMINGGMRIVERLFDIPWDDLLSTILVGFVSAALIDWFKIILEKERFENCNLHKLEK